MGQALDAIGLITDRRSLAWLVRLFNAQKRRPGAVAVHYRHENVREILRELNVDVFQRRDENGKPVKGSKWYFRLGDQDDPKPGTLWYCAPLVARRFGNELYGGDE